MDKEKEKMVKKLDRLWSKIIHLRDKECQRCKELGLSSKDKRLHAHHIIHKGRGYALRWDTGNGILLCFNHHKAKPYELDFPDEKKTSHGSPEFFKDWVIKRIGKPGWDILNLRKRNRFELKIGNLKLVEMVLKKELEDIENGKRTRPRTPNARGV